MIFNLVISLYKINSFNFSVCRRRKNRFVDFFPNNYLTVYWKLLKFFHFVYSNLLICWFLLDFPKKKVISVFLLRKFTNSLNLKCVNLTIFSLRTIFTFHHISLVFQVRKLVTIIRGEILVKGGRRKRQDWAGYKIIIGQD